MQTIHYFIDMYVNAFPDQRRNVEAHIELNGTLLGHIFFDEEICGPLCRMLRRAQTSGEIKSLVNIMEAMLLEGDEYVKSVVTKGVLKKLRHERDIYEKARVHFSDEMIKTLEQTLSEE